ncbi:MAG: hypothetical protein WA896_13745 [Spirulinaceae cyanobacterium]
MNISTFSKPITAALAIGTVISTQMSVLAQTSAETIRAAINNQAQVEYQDPSTDTKFQGFSTTLGTKPESLVDPLGRILGCGGNVLDNYGGFTVALYEPNPGDPTGSELGRLVNLSQTEFPDTPNNGVPGGRNPNSTNINPFPLDNINQGQYNFLFDPAKGQTNPGQTYILVINPPTDSIYTQRRIKIEILSSVGSSNNSIVRYRATSLDGQPISVSGGTQITDQMVEVFNAEAQGLTLFALQFDTVMCQADQIDIVKTGDRATAEPGDTILYRISIRNKSDVPLNRAIINDRLPLGFKFLPNSVQGELQGQPVEVTTTGESSSVTMQLGAAIPPGEVLNIVYAAQLTPDSLRGSGINSAVVNAQRSDNDFRVKDGPTNHRLRVDPGILADCGTLIGRVFVDKNFDGEQQNNEPGVPNAVIMLEDGNRITTDADGLFSVASVHAGYHAGTLDFTSLPGYTIAPNIKFSERNSQSRLVRLAPGGMARMNFAVTPTFQEEIN